MAAVTEIEVKFRVYDEFHYVRPTNATGTGAYTPPGEKPYSDPLLQNSSALSSGKYVYVFRTTRGGDVYLYAFYNITDTNKNGKFSVPLREFRTKVKCFFIVSEFRLHNGYIDILRSRIKNDISSVLARRKTKNRWTYADLLETYDEWDSSTNPYETDHVIFDEDENCNIVYLYDYRKILTKFRDSFDTSYTTMEDFLGGQQSHQVLGDNYIKKFEHGSLVSSICDSMDKWDMLDNDGTLLKRFLGDYESEHTGLHEDLDEKAQYLVYWLKTPGFHSFVQDYDYTHHSDQSIDTFLSSIIDNIHLTPAGSTYTVQEMIQILNDYQRLKQQESIQNSGAVTTDELAQFIENDIKYSSLASLIVKAAKTSDSVFTNLAKIYSTFYYTDAIPTQAKEVLTQVFVKAKIGLDVTFKEVNIARIFSPKSTVYVNPDGGSVRLIQLQRPNWIDFVVKHKDVFSKIEAGLVAINFVICLTKLYKLNGSSASLESKITTIASFAKATADLLRVIVIKEISKRVASEAAKTILKKATTALNWAGHIINVASYGWKTYKDITEMDYDAAFASGMVTLGSIGLAAISLGFLSLETGVGIIIFIAGIILVVAGIIMKIFTDDTNIDDYLKECQWGKYPMYKKKHYNDFQAQIDYLYEIAVNYSIKVNSHLQVPDGLFSSRRVRCIEVTIRPTVFSVLTGINLELELRNDVGATRSIWSGFCTEENNIDIFRIVEDGKVEISSLTMVFCDARMRFTQDDYKYFCGDSNQFEGHQQDPLSERYAKRIRISRLDRLVTASNYKTAIVKTEVDLNGDGGIIVEQDDVTCSLILDHTTELRRQTTNTMIRARMPMGF